MNIILDGRGPPPSFWTLARERLSSLVSGGILWRRHFGFSSKMSQYFFRWISSLLSNPCTNRTSTQLTCFICPFCTGFNRPIFTVIQCECRVRAPSSRSIAATGGSRVRALSPGKKMVLTAALLESQVGLRHIPTWTAGCKGPDTFQVEIPAPTLFGVLHRCPQIRHVIFYSVWICRMYLHGSPLSCGALPPPPPHRPYATPMAGENVSDHTP